MNKKRELNLILEDHERAFTEVSFLLDMFVRTIGIFVGKAAPSLAIAAGKNMARNLPVYLADPTPEEALQALVHVFSRGFDISGGMNSKDEAVVTIRQCPIRHVCTERGIPVDGQVCRMFHYYIAGIMAALTGRQSRPATDATGDTCTFHLAFDGSRP